jgi:ribose-phosphate pyrophosphokinase
VRELAVYAGSASPALAERVSAGIGVPLGDVRLTRFPDTETHVQIGETVRGKDVFLIQSAAPPVNERLMELFILLDAFRRASVARLTAVVPYLAYSRQEKKSTGREPISARLVADLLGHAGADRVLSIDLHTPAIQGFFEVAMDHLSAIPLLAGELLRPELRDAVIVAPDVGRAKLAERFARLLDLPLAIVHKRRRPTGDVEVRGIVGDVRDRIPIVIDDIIATGGTVAAAVEALIASGARGEIVVAATHGLFAGDAARRLAHPAIREILVTDTLEPPPKLATARVVSVSELLAEALRRIHEERSISELYPTLYPLRDSIPPT